MTLLLLISATSAIVLLISLVLITCEIEKKSCNELKECEESSLYRTGA